MTRSNDPQLDGIERVLAVFAHPDDHQAVKDYAAKLAKKRKPATPTKG